MVVGVDISLFSAHMLNWQWKMKHILYFDIICYEMLVWHCTSKLNVAILVKVNNARYGVGNRDCQRECICQTVKNKSKNSEIWCGKGCLGVNRQVLEPCCCHLKVSVLFNIIGEWISSVCVCVCVCVWVCVFLFLFILVFFSFKILNF